MQTVAQMQMYNKNMILYTGMGKKMIFL